MMQFSNGTLVPEDRVRRAAEYHYFNSERTKPRSRASTTHSFSFLRNERDYTKLRKYYEQGLDKISKAERLKIIAHRLRDIVEERRQRG
ncbi:hypothetical protein OESDEN_20940 [Oesophagostomum dentatum]|uniref:Uncharacterized protein n=1 Tax=Oesophagostomum dentatum TaxID=61180 RepID=A0A0B1S3A4_OESDE|nr:hypothetical protein OESDEN_20940 [Oesophagostomum dentatum]